MFFRNDVLRGNYPSRNQLKRTRTGKVTGSRRRAFEHLEDRRLMAVDFAWAFTLGSAGGDNVRDMAVDPSGNICIVGKFAGTVDFDPGPGDYSLTASSAEGRDNYVAKYDTNGNLLSAQQFGGAATDSNDRSMAFDALGNMYVTGAFTGTAVFGSTTLVSQGLEDVFAAKFDSSGNIVWARRFGGANADYESGVATDIAGNVVVSATVLGPPQANGSPANSDALITKLDTDGNTLWTTVVGASSSIATKGKPKPTGSAGGAGITVDSTGAVYATGNMSGTVDFDAGSGTTALTGSGFVFKLNSTGGLSWARTFVGSASGGNAYAANVAVDAAGNVFTAGRYSGSVDFDPGTLNSQKFVLTSNRTEGYVSALNSSGNFLWAKSTRSVTNGQMVVDDLVLDAANNIYISGDFTGAVDFDPAAGDATLNANTSFITFVWKLNANGGYEWAGAMGTQGDHYGDAVDVDASGNIYTAGWWSGSGDFDPGAGTFNLTANGYDGYLVKLTQTNSLSLAKSSAIANAANLLVASDNDTATKTKQHAESNWTQPLSALASSVDEALAEIENLLVASDNNTPTKTKRQTEGNCTPALSGLASSVDEALARMEISVWR